MAISLGEATYSVGLDYSQLQAGLNQADGIFQGWANNAASSIQRVGEVAMGVLVAQAIPAIINGFANIAKQAIGVTANLQAMQIGMEGLLAREISKGQEVVTQRKVRVELTAKEKEKLQDLNLQRDQLNAKLQEETERHRQLTQKWGAEGLAVKTHAASMAILKEKIDDTNQSISALTAKQGSYATVTDKTRVGAKALGDAMPEAQAKAKKLMDELARIAILSPYQLDVVNNTFKQAMAFGYGSDEAAKLTKAMLNVAAGVGAGNEQMGRMSYNFAQIRMVGKVTAMDVRQLAMAGFDLNSVLQYTGEKFKIAINGYEDFNKAIASGKITWAQFTDAFAEYADKNFGGASERMSRTLNGLQSTFHDLFALTMPQVVGPALEEATGLLNQMLNEFLGIRDSGVLEDIGKRLGESVKGWLTPFKRFFDYIDESKKAAGSMAGIGGATMGGAKADMLGGALQAAFGPKVLGPLNAVRDTIRMVADAFAAVKNAAAGVWQALQPIVDLAVSKITAFVQLKDVVAAFGVILASAILPALIGAAGAFLSFAAPIAAVIAGVALLRRAWETNFGGIRDKVTAALDAVKVFAAAFTGDFSGLYQTLSGFQQQIDAVFGAGATANILVFGRDAAGAFNAVKAKFGELVTAFQTGGLPAVGQKLGEWWGQLQTFLATNAPIWGEQIKQKAGELWGKLVTWWDTDGLQLVGQIGQKLSAWWQGVVTFVQTNAPIWGEQLRGFMAQVWTKLTTFDTGNSSGLTGFGQFVKQIQDVIASLQPVFQQLEGIFGPTVQRIGQAFAGLGGQFDAIKPKFAALWEQLQPIAKFLGEVLAAVLVVVAKAVGELLAGELEHIVPLIGGVTQVFTGLAEIFNGTSDRVKILGELFGGLMTILDNLVGLLWDALVNTVNDIFKTTLPSWEEFKKGVESAITGMVKTVTTKIGEIVTTVTGKFEEVLTYIRNLPDLLIKHGEAIIDGLFTGITNAWGRMVKKFQELVALLPAVVKKILGIESPSKVFAAIGAQMTAGLAVGFEAGAAGATTALLGSLTGILQALADWADTQIRLNNNQTLNSAKAVSEPLAQIIRNVLDIAAGVQALALVQVPANLAAKVTAITGQLDPIIRALQAFADQQVALDKNHALESAAAVADPVARTLTNLQTIAQALATVGDVRLDAGAVSAQMPVMVDALRSVVTSLATLAARLPAADVASAMAAAGTLAAVAQPFELAARAMQAIYEVWRDMPTDWLRVTPGSRTGASEDTPWQRVLNWLKAVLRAMQMGLTQLQADYGDVPGALTYYAGQLTALIAPYRAVTDALKPMLDLMALAQPLTAGARTGESEDTAWQRVLNWLKAVLRAMKMGLDKLQTEYGAIPDTLTRYAGQLAALVAPYKAVSEAVKTLHDLAGLDPDWLVSTAGTATGSSADTGWQKLLNWLKAVLRAMKMGLAKLLADYGDIPESLSTYATRLTAIIAPYKAVAETVKTLMDLDGDLPADWRTETAGSATGGTADTPWQKLLNFVKRFMRALKQGLEKVQADYGDIPESLVTFATRLQTVAGAFQAAIGVLTSLTAVKQVHDLDGKMAEFGNVWYTVLTELDKLRLRTKLIVTDVLVDFAKAVGDIATGLGNAVKLLTGLAEWRQVPDIRQRVSELITAIDGMLDDLKPVVAKWDSDGLKTVSELGQAIGNVMNGLQAALNLALALPKKWQTPGRDVWRPFFDWAMDVFTLFASQVIEWTEGQRIGPMGQQLGPLLEGDRVNVVATVAGAFGNVMTALQAALNLALALPATWAAPSPAVWDPFFTWATGVFQQFAQKVQEWTTGSVSEWWDLSGDNLPILQRSVTEPLFGPDTAKTVSDIASAFSGVFGALSAALQLALADWDKLKLPDLETTMKGFVDWVGGVFEKVADYIAQKWPAADDKTFAPVAAFGGAMQAVMGGLQSGLELLKGLVWYVAPAEANVTNFLNGVKLVIEKIRDGAAGVLTAAQSEAMQTFGSVMSTLFGAMQTALSLFDALSKFDADTSPSGKFAHHIQVFDAALLLAVNDWVKFLAEDFDPVAAQLVADFAPIIKDIADGFQAGLNLIGALNEQGVPTTDKLDAFLKLILKLFGDFTKELKAVVDADDWQVLGKDMLGGLIAGINAEKPKLLDAARTASYDAYLEVKKALGIASPSKVFAGLGVQIPAGVVQGIEAGQARLAGSLRGMFAQYGAPDLQIDTRREAHIYLHADGDLSGLGAGGTNDLMQGLADFLRLGGLRVAVA